MPKYPLGRAFAQVRALSPEVCKTVGSAYVGSNPTPATTYNPSSSGMRRDHRRWLQWLQADLGRRSGEFSGVVSGQVRALRPDPARIPRPASGRHRRRRLSAPLPAGMHDDAYRGNPREGYRVVLADLDPVSTGDRETDVIPLPLSRLPVRAARKQRDALIAAHGRDIRSESSSCTIVTPAAAARRGLQLKAPVEAHRRRPAAGALLTASSALMQPGNS